MPRYTLEQLRLQCSPKRVQWRRRSDRRWHIVPYSRSSVEWTSIIRPMSGIQEEYEARRHRPISFRRCVWHDVAIFYSYIIGRDLNIRVIVLGNINFFVFGCCFQLAYRSTWKLRLSVETSLVGNLIFYIQKTMLPCTHRGGASVERAESIETTGRYFRPGLDLAYTGLANNWK